MYEEYLGDGVYVSFDGYHFVLKANSHIAPTDTIALDSHVTNAFLKYVRRIEAAIKEEKENNP